MTSEAADGLALPVEGTKDWPIKDQGRTNACVAFALTALHEFTCGVHDATFSEGSLLWASGLKPNNVSTFRHVGDTLSLRGQLPEASWPFDLLGPPSRRWSNPALVWSRLPTVNIEPSIQEIVRAVDSTGVAVVGLRMTTALLKPSSDGLIDSGHGVRQIPSRHALAIVGYSGAGSNRIFIARNSWGRRWGVDGYGFLTESFLSEQIVEARMVAEIDSQTSIREME